MTRKLGISFAESIVRGSYGPRRLQADQESNRWVLLLIGVFVFSIIAFARLVDLQLIRGSYFKALAEGNRIRRIPIKAPRGEIQDRNGHALARNVPVYKLGTFGAGGVVQETEGISRDEALRIQAEDPEKEARLIVDVGREYPQGAAAAHVVGYVNEASAEEVAGVSGRTPPRSGVPACPVTSFQSHSSAKRSSRVSSYQLGDLVGRTGVERQYECTLRGINGEELVEVDTRGRLVRKLGRREPVPGKTIQLAIDAGLQEAAYKALENAPLPDGSERPAFAEGFGEVRGAVVAQNPETGEVLALVSAPSFDPNTLTTHYSQLTTDPNLPLFNRVIAGAYPPGSAFKPVVAVAALEEGKIDEEYEYEDKGLIRVGAFVYRNWYFTQYGRTEGLINVVRAITRSTDTFFYKVGEMAGPEHLAEWAGKFGLGTRTGIDLSGEGLGLVPTPEWKEKTKGERWFLGNTFHLAIGQGDITATPLQVNTMTTVIASGGKWCKPKVIKDIEGKCEDLQLSEKTLELVTRGMVGACSPGGTAFPLFNFEIPGLPDQKSQHEPSTNSSEKASAKTGRVACKTGTAEFGDAEDRTHAWLTAFAPAPDPQISITALVEAGGEGSRVAAPVVREVLDYWFHAR